MSIMGTVTDIITKTEMGTTVMVIIIAMGMAMGITEAIAHPKYSSATPKIITPLAMVKDQS
jgi:hypothetical protein